MPTQVNICRSEDKLAEGRGVTGQTCCLFQWRPTRAFIPHRPGGSGARTPHLHPPPHTSVSWGKGREPGERPEGVRAGALGAFPPHGDGRPEAGQPPGEQAGPSGGDRHGLLCSAAATGVSPARGAVRKREWGAAPSRAAPSAASLTGTRSPACRPRPTCASGAPTTSIPRGESTRPSATPSPDQAFLVQFGIPGLQRAQTTSELESVRQVLLKIKRSRKLSWPRVAESPVLTLCAQPGGAGSGRRIPCGQWARRGFPNRKHRQEGPAD